MTKGEYMGVEAWYMSIPAGHDESVRAYWHASLAAAWHSLSDTDRAELDARPPDPGRPRFVSAGCVLKPTDAGWRQGLSGSLPGEVVEAFIGISSKEAVEAVSGAADDAVEGK